MNHDNLPRRNPIWLLFDLDNGHRGSHHYTWWFDTRREAREFKARHTKTVNTTELFGPVKATFNNLAGA